jgi:hypothetical protein
MGRTLTFEELRSRFPDPAPNPLLDTRRPWAERVAESQRRYCVGGALLRALGHEEARFPTVSELARGLAEQLGADPTSDRSALERTALAIANANDDGRIADAWELLRAAIVEHRLVPDRSPPAVDPDPDALDRWIESLETETAGEARGPAVATPDAPPEATAA